MPSKNIEKIIEEFEKKYPQFKGVGASFPIFAENPVYTHILDFLRSSLLKVRKETLREVKKEIDRIIAEEIVIAHTEESGKTSRLTSTANKINLFMKAEMMTEEDKQTLTNLLNEKE